MILSTSPGRRPSAPTTLVPHTVSLGLPSRINFRPITGNRERHMGLQAAAKGLELGVVVNPLAWRSEPWFRWGWWWTPRVRTFDKFFKGGLAPWGGSHLAGVGPGQAGHRWPHVRKLGQTHLTLLGGPGPGWNVPRGVCPGNTYLGPTYVAWA